MTVVDERYDGRTTIVDGRPEFGVVTAINVSSLRESDAGHYRCRATTHGGDDPRPSYGPPPTVSPPPNGSTTVLVATPRDEDTDDGARFRLEVEGDSFTFTRVNVSQTLFFRNF